MQNKSGGEKTFIRSFGLINKRLWLKRIEIIINKLNLEHNLATTCTSLLAGLPDKSLKEFVQNTIVRIQKKTEKEDEDNLINVNLLIMFGFLKGDKTKLA